MGLIFRLIKKLFKLAFWFTIFAAAIVLIPNIPPYSKFSAIKLEPTQSRIGPLALNGDLNNAEKLYKGKLLGPEAFKVYNGEVYTSLATGEIVKISCDGHITLVTKIGQKCNRIAQAEICGRPLGFDIDEKNSQLYVADAYYGIWKVDLNKDEKQLLVSPHVEIEGRRPKLFNDLALAKNGDLYWTDSTSEFLLKDGSFSSLTDPTGRLFYYNAAKNQSKVLLDNLWFPNGVAISPDNQFVVVSETMRLKLTKYYIDGPKKGKSEDFVVGLPGAPDNLRTLPDGSGFLAALYTSFDEDYPLIVKSMSETPIVRKFFARLLRLIEIPFEFLNNQYPHIIFEEIEFNIGNFKSLSGLMPGQSGLVQLDWNGNIIAAYYNTDGSQKSISDAVVYNDKLYMGSPNDQDYIAAVPVPPRLKKAFGSAKPLPSKTEEIPTPIHQSKPAEPPKRKPVETPKEQPVEPPKLKSETPKEKPVETPKQKPVEVPKQKPVETPKEKPIEPSKQKPIETLKEKPVEAPKQKPVEIPKQKPVETPKQKAADSPKDKSHEKSKVEEKKDTIKTQDTVKPSHTKPIEQVEKKPADIPKVAPIVKPPQPSKENDGKADAQPAASKPEVKTLPKQSEPKTTAPKNEPKASTPETQKSGASKTQKSNANKQSETKQQKPVPEAIPIKEEIPSDTVKPNKETLKVIKKGGPTEIPNPEL